MPTNKSFFKKKIKVTSFKKKIQKILGLCFTSRYFQVLTSIYVNIYVASVAATSFNCHWKFLRCIELQNLKRWCIELQRKKKEYVVIDNYPKSRNFFAINHIYNIC